METDHNQQENQQENQQLIMLAEMQREQTVTAVLLGVILYMGISLAAQFILFFIWAILCSVLSLSLSADSSLVSGGVMILSVLFSMGAAYIYFNSSGRRILLFQGVFPEIRIFQKKKHMRPELFAGLCILIFLLQFVYGWVLSAMEQFLNEFGLTMLQSASISLQNDNSVTMFLYVCLVGPFVEEFIYRGLVMHGLSSFGKTFAIVMSSVIFGFMHCDLPQLFVTTLIGLILAYIAMEYGFLWGLLLHIFNNLVLGELWSSLLKMLDGDALIVVYFTVLIAVSAGGTIFLVKSFRTLSEWLRRNRPPAGIFSYAVNFWLILFIAGCIVVMLLQIKPYIPEAAQPLLEAVKIPEVKTFIFRVS